VPALSPERTDQLLEYAGAALQRFKSYGERPAPADIEDTRELIAEIRGG
jgi:hypothetical protein